MAATSTPIPESILAEKAPFGELFLFILQTKGHTFLI